MHSLFSDLDGSHLFVPFILIPVIFIFGGVVVAVAAIYYHFERQKLWHETMRVSLEKGVPLPPTFTPGPQGVDKGSDRRWSSSRSPYRDLRTGLILVAVGLALSFQNSGGNRLDWHSGGIIPLYIGCAFLVFALFAAIFRRGQ